MMDFDFELFKFEELMMLLKSSPFFKQSSLNGNLIFKLTEEGKIMYEKMKYKETSELFGLTDRVVIDKIIDGIENS